MATTATVLNVCWPNFKVRHFEFLQYDQHGVSFKLTQLSSPPFLQYGYRRASLKLNSAILKLKLNNYMTLYIFEKSWLKIPEL